MKNLINTLLALSLALVFTFALTPKVKSASSSASASSASGSASSSASSSGLGSQSNASAQAIANSAPAPNASADYSAEEITSNVDLTDNRNELIKGTKDDNSNEDRDIKIESQPATSVTDDLNNSLENTNSKLKDLLLKLEILERRQVKILNLFIINFIVLGIVISLEIILLKRQ